MKRVLLALLLLVIPAQAQHSHGDKKSINFATLPSLTVAGLGACAAGNNGEIRKVSDGLAPTVGIAVVGGGAVALLVHCQSGTGWIVG